MSDRQISANNDNLFSTPLLESQRLNSELNYLEYQEQRPLLNSYPRRIVFELTNRCNFCCIMCGREAAEFACFDLPLAVIRKFAPCFRQVEEVTLHGWGEGTLHPEFTEILAYLNTYPQLRKYFVTNGSTLDRILEPIFQHQVDLVAISLDGATAGTNDSIRRNGSLERQLHSVRNLLREKTERRTDYPYVNFVFTAMRRNIAELSDLVDLAAAVGIPEVKVVYLTIFSPHLLDETLYNRQDQVRSAFAAAGERAERHGIKLKLPEIQKDEASETRRHRSCPFPWRDLFIGSDGRIRPCQSSPDHLGSALDWHDFADLWNSPRLQEFRRRVNDDLAMPAGCFTCYHSSCANYDLPHSFLQLEGEFAPKWHRQEAPSPALRPPSGPMAETSPAP